MRKSLLLVATAALNFCTACAHAGSTPATRIAGEDVAYAIPESESAALRLAHLRCDSLTDCQKKVRELDRLRQREAPGQTLYLNACELGDAYSCWVVADLMRRKILPVVSTPPFRASHVAILAAECELKDAFSCFALSRASLYGMERPKDAKTAYTQMSKACELGLEEACVEKGDMIGRGWGVEKAEQVALSIFLENCTKSRNRGCFFVGFTLLGAYGMEHDSATMMLSYFRRACERGDPHGCSSVGWAHENGRGVPADDTKAIAWFRFACQEGHNDGCRNAGRMLESQGSPSQLREAATLYERGCDTMGDSVTCRKLGFLLLPNDGFTNLPARAVSYLERACDLKDVESCDWLLAAHKAGGIVHLPAGCAKDGTSCNTVSAADEDAVPTPIIRGKCTVDAADRGTASVPAPPPL